MSAPVHEHDCDMCAYIASYPLRHPYMDDEDGYRTGVPFKWVGMGDVYLTCDPDPFTRYIVRYGVMGEYATTNDPATYLKVPWIKGKTRFD